VDGQQQEQPLVLKDTTAHQAQVIENTPVLLELTMILQQVLMKLLV